MRAQGGKELDRNDDLVIALGAADEEGLVDEGDGGDDVVLGLELDADLGEIHGLKLEVTDAPVNVADVVEGLEGGERDVNVASDGLPHGVSTVCA